GRCGEPDRVAGSDALSRTIRMVPLEGSGVRERCSRAARAGLQSDRNGVLESTGNAAAVHRAVSCDTGEARNRCTGCAVDADYSTYDRRGVHPAQRQRLSDAGVIVAFQPARELGRSAGNIRSVWSNGSWAADWLAVHRSSEQRSAFAASRAAVREVV